MQSCFIIQTGVNLANRGTNFLVWVEKLELQRFYDILAVIHGPYRYNMPSIILRISPVPDNRPFEASTNATLTAGALSFLLATQKVQVDGYCFMNSVPPLSANISPKTWVAMSRIWISSTRSSSSNCGTTLCRRDGHERFRRLIKSWAL
jgi:hypothetical protein